MSQGVFVTGTDTEIGKTLVSCLLINEFTTANYKVIGMKPIASGAELIDGQLRNEDAMHLMSYSNVTVAYEKINPYCFEPPVAPHIAAQHINQEIELATIKNAYADLTQQADWVIVEGVGGWYVPINARETVADIAAVLDLPVILVVGMRLGCINHAILTANAIRASGCQLVGWIANSITPKMDVYDDVLASLKSYLKSPLLAEIPFLSDDKTKSNQPIKIDLNILKS